jgi:ribosomal-protein-alanine N-acetyltransferase
VRQVSRTDRLILAEAGAEDWLVVAEVARADGFDDFNLGSRDAPPTDQDVQAWISFWRGLYPRGLGMWCLLLRDTGTLIGVAGVKPRQGHDDLELKYNLARRFWGQGFGTEGAGEALRLAEAEAVVAVIDERNVPSKRVVTKLGFCLADGFTDNGIAVELWRWLRPTVPQASISAIGSRA